MERPISSSSLTQLRPIFANVGENIKHYEQLKVLLSEGKDYQIFAKPTVSGGQIDWFGDYDGELKRLSNMSIEEQTQWAGKLKYRINQLYRSALRYARTSPNQFDPIRYQQVCKILDACLEIPNYDAVCITETGDFILINWGFVYDKHNAESGLIKKMLPTRVTDITIQTVFKDNRQPAPNEPIRVSYTDPMSQYPPFTTTERTNESGLIRLKDFPFLARVEAASLDETSGQQRTPTHFIVDDRLPEQFYTLEIARPTQTMTFRVIDADTENTPLSNIPIFFNFNEKIQLETSNGTGQIFLLDVPLGMSVRCYQNIEGQPGNIHNFTCSRDTAEHIIRVKQIVIPPPPAPAMMAMETPLPAAMIFRTITPNGATIPNVALQLFYNGDVVAQTTDATGSVSLNDVPLNTLVKVRIFYKNRTEEREYISQTGSNTHDIVLKEQRLWGWLWWLLGLLLLLLLLLWAFDKCKKPIIPPPPPIPVVPVASKYTVRLRVLDRNEHTPVGGAKVEVGSIAPQLTDTEGYVQLDSQAARSRLRIYISKTAYSDTLAYLKADHPIDTILFLTKKNEGGSVGKRGDISVTIHWETIDDVDLHLKDPEGHEISFSNPKVEHGDYLCRLDVDANSGGTPIIRNPQENIYSNNPIKGTYEVSVVLYKQRQRSPIPFTIVLNIQGVEERLSGILTRNGEKVILKTFKIE